MGDRQRPPALDPQAVTAALRKAGQHAKALHRAFDRPMVVGGPNGEVLILTVDEIDRRRRNAQRG